MWKLDDPAVMKAELAERAQQAAQAAGKKLANKLQLLEKDFEKFEKLAAMPSAQQGLAEKYKFDEAGEPSHDKDGNALEGKVSSGAGTLITLWHAAHTCLGWLANGRGLTDPPSFPLLANPALAATCRPRTRRRRTWRRLRRCSSRLPRSAPRTPTS